MHFLHVVAETALFTKPAFALGYRTRVRALYADMLVALVFVVQNATATVIALGKSLVSDVQVGPWIMRRCSLSSFEI
jgi:hypothetical protein